MAEISSFPNNSDIYQGAEEVMRWLHGRTSGVYAGEGNAAVSATGSAMQIQVSPGIGWIVDADANGVCWWFDTAIQLTVDPAESTGTLNRIDRVIVEWPTTDYADLPEVKILKGTSASSAVAPALTNNSTVRQLSLARINIPAGTTELTQLNILDDRQDPTVCGIVTETVTADTSMIAVQYDEALQELLSAIAQAWSGVISDGSITRAKLAPPLLEEIGVKSVNGMTGTVVIDTVPMTLLWTNASPTSDFAAQTVQIDLSAYDFVMIEMKSSTTSVAYFTYIGEAVIGNKGFIQKVVTLNDGAGVAGIERQFTLSSSGADFTRAFNYVGNTTVNNEMIPYRIFGIKKT